MFNLLMFVFFLSNMRKIFYDQHRGQLDVHGNPQINNKDNNNPLLINMHSTLETIYSHHRVLTLLKFGVTRKLLKIPDFWKYCGQIKQIIEQTDPELSLKASSNYPTSVTFVQRPGSLEKAVMLGKVDENSRRGQPIAR